MISEERLLELWEATPGLVYEDALIIFARAVEAEAVSLERERYAQMLETVAGEVPAMKDK